MSWFPWRSGRSREREQRAESLARLTDDSMRRVEAARVETVAAAGAAVQSIQNRAAVSAELKPLLNRLIGRLTDDRFAHPRKDRPQ